ncbi:MAG: putative Ig domain-containing protein, partial [Candidatus Poseidoniaceae archaeon]|nr:putative Ig domain-containing protein [Candidatus Poseidoniaceae archaeon]
STSKRGLGIAGEDVDDRWATRFYRSTNTFVDQISIAYTDGTAIEFHGSAGQSNNNQINNSYFHHIDWSVTDLPGLMVTVFEGGRDFTFSNSTVSLTGASATLSLGDAPQIWHNEVWATGYLQSDGAVVQMMQEEQTDANIAYNWIHDTDKYGIRMDGPIGGSNNGRNATVHHNVLWNVSGALMVKGDYHEATNNTIFGGDGGKNHIIVLYENGAGNENSVIWNNAADSLAAHRANDIWDNPLQEGTDGLNWNGYTEGYRKSSASGYGDSNCIISNSQSLYCWGSNVYGNLGNGLHGGGVFSDQPVEITSFGTGLYPVEVATSIVHSCAILNDGTVSCWGDNSFGQLGDGTQIDRYVPTQTVSLGAGVKAVDIAVGGYHTCAVLDDGDVKCWGLNGHGQIGDNSQIDKYVPTSSSVFTGTSKAIAITAGYDYSCALIVDGSVRCWGKNNLGQLGLGTSVNPVITPTQTASFGAGLHAVDIDAGYAQACALLNDGRIMCWGLGSNGRLGTGDTLQQTSPTFTASLGTNRYAKQVVQGGSNGCAIIDDGTVRCWGGGTPTGTGTSSDVLTPTTTDSLGVGRTAQALIAGTGHSCVILDDATMACWGFGGFGKLGNGASNNELSPVPVTTSGVPKNWEVSDFLVDPDNRDFRPKWGSPLHVLDAGAYDADDSTPWVPGIKWSYSPLSNPTVGCTHEGALNYDSTAEFEDGSCNYIIIAPSATSAQLSASTTMTPITVTATTSYVTNSSFQPFHFAAGYDVHQDMDIAIDNNGNSHICFRTPDGGGNLFYMTDVTGVWAWEGVHTSGSVNVGLECNIEIDSNDIIHIVYQKVNTADIKYATRAISSDGSISGDSSWSKSNLNTASDLGSFISMDIDKDDTLYVAYFRGPPSGQDLLFSQKVSGGSWTHGTIDTSGTTGRYNSIVVDDLDLSIHVSYKDGTGNNLKYATKEVGSTWSNQNVDSSNSTNGETSIALDSNGYVHIVSTAPNSNSLIYSTNAGGSGFVTTPIDGGTDGEEGAMIRLDDNDNVHIVYHARATDKLNYSSNAQGAWITQTLDGESTSRGKGVSMELDSNGDMHMAYLDQDNNQLRFSKFRSLANTETYEIHPDLPSGLSFGANNGTIWGTPTAGFSATDYTIYANTTTQSATTTVQLMSMWQVEPSVAGVEMMKDDTLTPITFNWSAWSSSLINSTNAVYSSGDSGNYNSIVTDSNGKVHIVSFSDGTNDDLKYSTNVSGSWQTNNIESSGNVGQYCSIAIDSNDGLHVSYQYGSGNKLKYAYKASGSSSWSKTDVDGTGGKYTSIAIDSNDKPHIAYRDSGGDLGYAEKTGSSWNWNPIVSSVDVGWTSIAIDTNDDVHIAFYDTIGDDLHYVTGTLGSFVDSNLMDISDAGGTTLDIAVSPITDEPGISYLNAHSDDLEYKVYDGSSWSTTVVHTSGSVGRYNSLVYDSQGSAHISYEKNQADDLWYATDATGSWVTKGIHEGSSSTGLYTAIAVDINDDLHIAYRHNTGQDLYHATVQGHNTDSSARSALLGATCTFTPSLPTGLSVEAGTCTISGAPSSIQLNTTHTITATSSTGLSYTGEFYLNVLAQTPVISYTGSPFTYAKDVAISPLTPTNTGGDIPLHVIDSIGDVGNSSSMVMDSNGKIHIAYSDITNTKVKYATDKSGAWVDTIIGTFQGSISIAVDSNNNVHIAYTSSLNLYYATDKSGSWVSSVADSTFGTGFYPSIAIDSNDKVHIAHHNLMSSGRLRHTTDASGSWVTSVLTLSGQDNGQWPSIAIDSNDKIHISYYQAAHTSTPSLLGINYITDKSGAWVSICIDNFNAAADANGPPTSLSIDSNDNIHISYFDDINEDLKYATDKSGSWQTSIIDSTGESGHYSSLAVDSSDNVHISYFQNPNGDLKYATDKSGSWATSTLDSEGHIGPHNSLLVDSSGNIHVSYYDETNGDLNYLISSTNGRQGWSISPALPDGLVFDENTGEISGTPTLLSPSATYTITATNSGGTDTAIISLSVVDALPSISYSTTVFDLIVDETMNSITPSNSGGAVTSWSISPGVPTGLDFNTTTG